MNAPHEPDEPSPDRSEEGSPPAGDMVTPTGPASESVRVAPDVETTGDAALDARLSEPILQGYRGIETAQVAISAFLVVVVGALAYCNSLSGDFVGQDRHLIVDNAALHRLATLPEAVQPGGPGPLALAFLSLNWLATPGSPLGFHVVNILIHLINVLLYGIARTLLRSRTSEAVCMTAGLLLAVLPVATGTVDYVVARGALLATFFSCGALLFAWRATADPSRIRTGAMVLSVVCHVAAPACAPPAIVLPLITIGYVWTVRGALGLRSFLPWAGWLILLQLANLVVLFALLGTVPGRLIAVPWFMLRTLVSAVFPVHLSIAHGLPYFSYVITFVVLFFLGSFILALLVLRRRAGLPLLWFASFAMATAATTAPGDLLAERHFYLPLAGLMLLVPWGLTRMAPGAPRVVAGIVVAVLTLSAGWTTLQRNVLWSDPALLWAEAEERYPDEFEPKHELGRLAVLEGQTLSSMANHAGQTAEAESLRTEASRRSRAAIALLSEALTFGDPHTETHVLLAEAYLQAGQGAEAHDALLSALDRDPSNYDATLQLASMLEAKATAQGDRVAAGDAVSYYGRARDLQPLSPERLARFGMLLASVGRFEDAADALSEAVGGRQSSPYAEALRGVLEKVKQLRDLEQFSATQMRSNAADPSGLRARAQVQLIRGQYLEASYVLERLIKQYPQDYGSWMFLGLARAKMDEAKQFVAQHGQPPASPDAGVTPWQDLAERVAAMGSWEAATIYLNHATTMPELERELTLARWALAQRNSATVTAAIERAKALTDSDPRPWLYDVDRALLEGRLDEAEAALAEAKRRGADAEALDDRGRQLRQLKAAASAPPPAAATAGSGR